MHVCGAQVWPVKSEGGVGFPGTRVIDGVSPKVGVGWGQIPGLLQEQVSLNC